MSYINISGYKFKNLTNLEVLQQALKSTCFDINLKGTILIGFEGINAFLSGHREDIDKFYRAIQTLGFDDIVFKESSSEEPPFKRMIVKIKAEIVTMGIPEINPGLNPAPSVTPETFKLWLDEEKPIVVLDTRNDYEVRLGKFKNAIHLNISNFRSFPEAIKQLPDDYKNKPIITYCTGGIRCEKAAPYMINQGFENVYQLDGGILKYLEKFGHEHYEGECFVFDKRIAVDTVLQETQTIQCIACREPVTSEEQATIYFVPGKSCPYCYSV